MKKLLLGLGAITAITIPIVAVVSCAASAQSFRKSHEMHDSNWLTVNGYHYVETKTETLAFSWNHKDHITYEVWVNDSGKKAYHEIG